MAPVHSSFLASACNILVLNSNLVLVQEPRYHHVQKELDFHCCLQWVLSNSRCFHLNNSLFLSFQHTRVSKDWSNFRCLSHHCGMLATDVLKSKGARTALCMDHTRSSWQWLLSTSNFASGQPVLRACQTWPVGTTWPGTQWEKSFFYPL